jgi:hypothetical protein
VYVRTADGPGTRGSIALHVLNARGDTLVARNYPYEGIPIPERALDSVIAWRISANTRLTDPGGYAAAARKGALRFYQPVTRVRLGRDSTIWLALRAQGNRMPYLILDWRGDPIGTVSLPRESQIGSADRTSIWTIEANADDVPSVVRYRVEGWGAPPGSMSGKAGR